MVETPTVQPTLPDYASAAYAQQVEKRFSDAQNRHTLDDKTLKYNEILATASRATVSAISLPVCVKNASKVPLTRDYPHNMRLDYENLTAEDRTAMREFQAAILGINHLAIGMDLPVVFYHVTPPERGKVTFYAQGREMLVNKGVQAIQKLQDAGVFNAHFKDSPVVMIARTQAQAAFGVDILQPLAPQLGTLATRDITYLGTGRDNAIGSGHGY